MNVAYPHCVFLLIIELEEQRFILLKKKPIFHQKIQIKAWVSGGGGPILHVAF